MRQEEIDELKQLRRQGLTYREIAEATAHSPQTIQKYTKEVKPDKTMQGDMIRMPANPLDAINDLNDLVKLSTSTGISLGGGIAAIYRGFKDDGLSDKDRILSVMKGSMHLGGISYATYRVLQELIKAQEARKVKLVKKKKKAEKEEEELVAE